VPVPMLRPSLDQCVPTGVSLDGARVVVMADEGGVAESLTKQLAKAGAVPLAVDPGTSTEQLLDDLETWRADGEIAGVYWLAALDDEGPHDALDGAGWREALRRRVKTLYATMRRLYDDAPFLVAATRMGGFHGYDAAGATAPMGGAVSGFAKTYKRERPEALVKVVDFPASRKTTAFARLLLDETLRDPGCVEVGHHDGRRWGVGLAVRPFPASDEPAEGLALGPDSTIVVTGAAGSIVAAITADLAQASGATFHLLDLTPEPDPADPDLRGYVEDRDGLKSDLAARMKEQGARPTPVAIEKDLARLERLVAALTAIEAVRDAGGTVHYHSVDLTDAAAVAEVLEQVRATSGRIDLLLHAAGLEISKALPDKAPEEFDLVHGVKADGWFNVVHAAGDLPIAATVAFSSVAGRFGNAGQADYSSANDLLCKIASSFRRTRPETRALVLDWTAWGGIGMATRGSIPKVMEMAGVEMLPPEAGVAWVRREVTAHDFRGEVVVAGELGRLADGYHPTGGLDTGSLDLGDGPMVGEVTEANLLDGLRVQTTLDPATQPFLDHHRIDGTAVLPGVMGMEAFAEAADLLTRGHDPEVRVVAVEDVDFLSPVKFYRDEPRTLLVTARLTPDGDDLVAECRLETERVLPGDTVAHRTLHFTGSVRLSTRQPEPEPEEQARTPHGRSLTPDEVYRLYFHGPAYRVVGEAWQDDWHDSPAAAGRLADDLPADRVPPTAGLVLAPRLAELCFQVAGLWEAGTEDRLALPAHVDRLTLLGGPSDPSGLVAVARPTGPGAFDCCALDGSGHVVLRLDGYRTVPMAVGLADDVRGPLRATMMPGD